MSWVLWVVLALTFDERVVADGPGSRLVTGEVTDESGEGIGGAEVVLSSEAGRTARSTLTDLAGRFRVPDVEPGAYRLHAKLLGFEAESVRVLVPGERAALVLRATATGAASGPGNALRTGNGRR